MVTVPALRPVTVPPLLTVAIEGLLLAQTPPEAVELKVDVLPEIPRQTWPVPEIVPAEAPTILTVSVVQNVSHGLMIQYVIVAVPAEIP
jgi:hypothetical protein